MNENSPQSTDERHGATSASNAEFDLLCPGRHQAQLGLPESPPSEDAESGRKIHDALAFYTLGDPAGLTLDERDTYDRCQEIEARKVVEFFGPDVSKVGVWPENPKVPEASRVWVKIPPNMVEHSCRPDCFHRLLERALIVEYKTGRNEVTGSPRNLQLRDEEVLIRGNFLITGDIGVVVVQPWITMNPEICVYTPEDSERARTEMFARVIASNDPKSPRVPGEVQCQFCRAKMSCQEYQRWAGSMVPGMVSLVDVPVSAWTPVQRAMFLEGQKIAARWLKECDMTLKAMEKQSPGSIPGWTIGKGAKVRSVNNPQRAFDRFGALGGNLEQFMACVDLGITALKQALATATGLRGKKLEAEIDKILDGICDINERAGSWEKVEAP